MLEDDLFQSANEGQLAVDVIETRESIIIRSAVAGVKPEEIDIHVTGDLVTIRGTRKQSQEVHDATVHYQECFWGAFSRSIILPHSVKAEEADATFKDGVLELTIPKTRGDMDVKIRDIS
jgi:HSP20 family protein